MEITGVIKKIGATQIISSKFKKRELVLTTEEKYPQDILLEVVQDKCEELDEYLVNQKVKVIFNIRGREWINPQGEAKYFNTLQIWNIVAEEFVETKKVSSFAERLKNKSLNNIESNFMEDAINDMQSDLEDDDLPI